ncbi:hypothetical protein ACFV1W_12505 [Kitasatospora sp. NPDC059648]|uniref:hypothetical protein n=1 Tax=Kitasatospora sp. NPDC059648 TaxID=3346894 RepID=UPI0036C85E49
MTEQTAMGYWNDHGTNGRGLGPVTTCPPLFQDTSRLLQDTSRRCAEPSVSG